MSSRMNGNSWLKVASLGFALCLAGCGRNAAPAIGGETHWLEPCDSDAECGTELACECGICTTSCTSTASCDAVAEGGRCVSSADADMADDCQSDAPEQVCVSVSSGGAGGAGNGNAGSGGEGGASAGNGGEGGAGATNQVRGARYDAEGSCFGPSEVAGPRTAPTETGCDDALTYALDADGLCWLFDDSCIPDDFVAVGDPRMGPVAITCTETFDRCASACAEGEVTADGACLSCDDARTRQYAAIEAVATDETLLGCNVDADCTVLSTDTACNGTCGRIAAVASSDEFAARVDEISAQYCSDQTWANTCGYSTPDCEQPAFSCQGNRCVQGVQPACVAQGGCDSPLTCFTETCAKSCTGSDACGEDERCVHDQTNDLCGLSVVTGPTADEPDLPGAGYCLTRCQTDADCSSVGDGMSCFTGYCVGELPQCETECPRVADTCADSCSTVDALPYFPGTDCRATERQTLGCYPQNSASTDDDRCVKSLDGTVFDGISGTHAARLISTGEYVECAPADLDAVSNATDCE